MRLFTAEFVQRWYGRMLNIHPSLLPSFPGLDPHGQALRAGVKISGATVHFVIPETDAGPIVMQGAVAVGDDDTAETLAARILQIEHRIYPDALRLVASGKIRLEGDVCKTAGSAGGDGILISPADELARWSRNHRNPRASWTESNMAKIAVVGCGAMGSVYAALMVDAGHEVHAVTLWPDHAAAMAATGLRCEGASGDRTVPISRLDHDGWNRTLRSRHHRYQVVRR